MLRTHRRALNKVSRLAAIAANVAPIAAKVAPICGECCTPVVELPTRFHDPWRMLRPHRRVMNKVPRFAAIAANVAAIAAKVAANVAHPP